MNIHQIQAARDYLREASGRGVLAIQPVALAQRIGVDEETATGLLLRIQKYEGLVEIKGFIECPNCSERIALQEQSAEGLIQEATILAGATCPYCDATFEQVRVRFSFFFLRLQRCNSTPTSSPGLAGWGIGNTPPSDRA